MEKVETSQPIAEQKSSVEVTKNTKGYGWRIKVYDNDPDKAFNEMVRIEKECQNKYGEEQSPGFTGKEDEEDDK